MRKLQLFVWLTAILMFAVSLIFKSWQITLSLGTGSLFVIISFYAIYLTIHLMSLPKKSTMIIAGLVSILKLGILGLLLWLIITKMPINLTAFLIGLGTIFIASFIYSIHNFCLGYKQNANI